MALAKAWPDDILSQYPLGIEDRMTRSLPGMPRVFSHGLSPKQEAFAQLVVRGENLSDAYRATYRAGGKPASINVSASKLAKNAKVRSRIEALLKQAEASMHRDSVAIRRHVFSGLMKESRNETAKPSERISALIALGKIDVVGMFRDVHTVQALDERRPEEVENELRSKLRELFRDPTTH
jgi:hypothetical protein